MKKFITFLILFVCMLSLVSCKGKNKKQPDEEIKQEENKDPENKPSWPEANIKSYCSSDNALPSFPGDYKDLSSYESNGNLCIDMDNVAEADYSNYCKALLNNGYVSKNLSTYEKSFNGFNITVNVYFNPDNKKLNLVITKVEIISGWPTSKISDEIGDEACLALPAFVGSYEYDFKSNEWFSEISIKGTNIVEAYNNYIDDLKTKYIVYEDSNEPTYKDYNFLYINSDFDAITFHIIYNGSVSIQMFVEKFELPAANLPNTYHLLFNLQWGKTLDIYRNGDDYEFVNTSSKYSVEAYKYNSTKKTYTCYSGEASDLNSIILNKGDEINYKEFMDILKENLYDARTKEGLNYEIDSEQNDTIASIPCEAHINKSYIHYIDPITNLLCKYCTTDYIFRELALFENVCTFPVELPQ